MKSLALALAAAVIALSFPACATASKKSSDCCTPTKQCPAGSAHCAVTKKAP